MKGMGQVSSLLQWLENQQGTLYNPLALAISLFFFLLLVLRLNRVSQSQQPNLPPSPPKFPIIGNLHQLGTFAHRHFRDLSQKYGPIMLLHLGPVPVVVVSSKDMAREIMKTNDTVFANRPLTTAATVLFYGCSNMGYSPYGEYWRQLRKIFAMKLLSIKKVQSFKFVREEALGFLVEKISRSCSSGKPINLSEMVVDLSMNVTSRCALGRKFGEDRDKTLEELPRKMSVLLGRFSFQDFFPSLGWMDVVTGFVRSLKETARELDTYIDQVIEEHLIQKKHGDIGMEDDFVYLLLQDHDDEKLDISLTRDNIKALLVELYSAGIDTTTITIEWTIAELIKNPNIMKKAQDEVRRVIGRKNKVEAADIQQMDYLNCVIKETLRLHPPGPLLLPRLSSTASNVGGYDIPSNTRVVINAWAIQRDPELWVEAEKFIPDRFMSKTIDFDGQGFEYFPFGAGRRICPGVSFALAVVESVLANLLYWFDWELPVGVNKDTLDMTEVSGISLNRKTPLHLVPTLHFP